MVTGSSGLLGRSLLRLLRDDCEVAGVDKERGVNPSDLIVDLSQKALAVASIIRIAPHVLVHTAAQTNVDLCESDRELARRVNVEGTANVAEGCAKIGAKLIFISTDYVFDGERGNYRESDQPNPIGFYGVTKLEAEQIAATLSNSLIIRTSVLYGWHPNKLNFATWILKGLSEHQSLRIVEDHINSPTLSDNLAVAIRVAIQRNSRGILHVAGSERISRFEFARRIARQFSLDERLLLPVKMKDLDWIARRPRDSSLNVGKAEKELGVELFGVDRGLDEMARSKP
jgi:dTDP-4-dehydrorhamnose reductase